MSRKGKKIKRTILRSSTSSRKKVARSKYLHLAVSGTPGTGKSTLARQIATLLDITYVDLTDVIKANRLYSTYDKKSKTFNVEVATLEKYLRSTLEEKQSYVLDSHLSHHLSKKLVSHVIVCTCNLKTLNKRLKLRKYSTQKIKDNLQAEIFDVCGSESADNGFLTLKVDCSKKLNINKIKSHLRQLLLLQ